MRIHAHVQQQVAGRATADARQPLATQPHPRAVGQPLRDRDADRLGGAAAVDADIGLAAVDGQAKGNGKPRRDVLARRLGRATPRACRAAATEEIAEPAAAAEEAFEVDLAASREAAAGKRAAPPATALAARADTLEGAAVAVIHFPLARVVEDVEGRLHLLELLLRRVVVRMEIRVILPRQFAVGLADVLGRCRAAHAERFVIVFRHRQ